MDVEPYPRSRGTKVACWRAFSAKHCVRYYMPLTSQLYLHFRVISSVINIFPSITS